MYPSPNLTLRPVTALGYQRKTMGVHFFGSCVYSITILL